MIKPDIASLRLEYAQSELNEGSILDNPFLQFEQWFQEAINAEIKEVNAMTLATADENNHPQARIVLLKSWDNDGFVFFTNYKSKKGKELEGNNKASLVFFWKELERQLRIQGSVQKIDFSTTKEYFDSRPLGSQLGALASDQSEIIENREALESKYDEVAKKYAGEDVPVPSHWGGYIVKPHLFEFWQGRKSRMHDRIVYEEIDGLWNTYRLQP